MADNKIQVALHSNGPRGVGLNSDNDLIINEKFYVPPPGKLVRYFDDFFGDLIADEWNVVEGSDTTTSNALIVSGIGGQCDLITGDSATVTYAGNGIQITHGAFYNWKAANGGLRFETRLKIDDITLTSFFCGFTDLGTFQGPIESAGSGNTLTTNASDAVGFMFDTRMTDDKIWLVGVAGDTDATAQNSGTAPVNGTYITLAVEIDSSGKAIFYINGDRVGTVMTGAVTTTVALTPTVAATSLDSGTSRTVSVDYVDVRMHRV